MKFFNFCWERAIVPLVWKKAVEVPIHLHGKSRYFLTSNRPIALNPLLGKLYESLTKNRLDYFFQKAEALPVSAEGGAHGTKCSAG